MSRLPAVGLLAADAISLTGTRLSLIAVPWFVLETTGSAVQTGVVAAVEMAPLVVFKVLGGPLVDRWGGRRVAAGCDFASAAVMAAIPLLHGLGWLDFGVLLVLVGLAGALRGPSDGAKQAMIPVVAGHAGVPLERVTGLYGAIERTAGMVGAALAGLLITVWGASGTLYVDAASFLVCGVVLLATTTALPKVETADRDPAPYLVQLRSGWDFLRRDAVLVGLCVMVASTNLLDLAWTAVLLPVWAQQSGAGAAGIGVLLTVFSGASILSSLGAARWGARLPRFWTYLLAFLVAGLPRFAVLAVGAPMWLSLVVFAVSGFASGFLNPILGAVVFERIPARLTGRVSALNTALCFSLMPLGGLVGGVLVSRLGPSWALWAAGVAYLLVTLAPLLVPSFREFDRRPEPAVPVS